MKFFKLIFLALLLLPSSAFALTELCGNGVDDDGAGGDASCPSPDADADGYTTDGTGLGYDCDDTNRRIFPGVEVTTGCSAGQWKTCQTNGTYSSCGNACPSGTCYHVDPVSGNNANAGTSYAAAFQNVNCLSYYSSGAPACNKHSTLACGDHIYLHAGTHSTSHSETGYGLAGLLIKDKSSCTANSLITIHFIGAAVIDLVTSSAGRGAPIYLDNADYTFVKGNTAGRITGTDVTDSGGGEAGGVTIRASDYARVSGLQIDNNLGHGDSNPGGIYLGTSSNVTIDHNDIFDQLNTGGNSGNNCLLMMFVGSGNRVSYNSFRYTSGATVLCGVRYKHGAYNSTFRLDRNIFSNSGGFFSASGGETVDHNIFADIPGTSPMCSGWDGAAAIGFCDNGGAAYDGTQVIEYNTVLNGRGAIGWSPTDDYDNAGAGCSNCGTFGTFSATNNVFQMTVGGSANWAAVNIQNYGSDADYASIITGGKYSQSGNCWYDASNDVYESLFGANPPTSGVVNTLSETNPSITAGTNVATGSCATKGWSVNWLESGGSSSSGHKKRMKAKKGGE